MNQLYVANKENLQEKHAAAHFVSLRRNVPDNPLFCLHPSGGDVGVYRKLVRKLPKTVGAMGIQSRLLAGETEEFHSVEAMASRYANLIDRWQREGPIRLLGFSFGGFVASVVSNELMKFGREVSFLGMIDSDLRWVADEDSIKNELRVRLIQLSLQFQELGVFQNFPIEKTEEDVEEMVRMNFGAKDPHSNLWLEFLQAQGYIAQESPQVQMLCRFATRFKIHCNLLTQFKASAFATPLNIWWPTEPSTDAVARREAWEAYTPYPIEERDLAGGHYSIMRMPTVASLAKDIYTRIETSSPACV